MSDGATSAIKKLRAELKAAERQLREMRRRGVAAVKESIFESETFEAAAERARAAAVEIDHAWVLEHGNQVPEKRFADGTGYRIGRMGDLTREEWEFARARVARMKSVLSVVEGP